MAQVDSKESDQVLRNLSVIVPFAAGDLAWKDLLQDLKVLPVESEILLVGPDAPDADIFAKAKSGLVADVRYVYSPPGRGRVLNSGARASKRDYFWFLHADSKVPRQSIFRLGFSLAQQPGSLHYFGLQFLPDGPRWMLLNSYAANLRSKHLGLPFGDQGFALSRSTFYRLGGFREQSHLPRIVTSRTARFDLSREGVCEDQSFVWEAHRKRVPLHRVPATIFTSARRYEKVGWAKLTRSRVWSTAQQAMIEGFELLKLRAIESIRR
jgi:hypothetical protein